MKNYIKRISIWLLAAILAMGNVYVCLAEEDSYEESYEESGSDTNEEGEYIPEDYYDPVATNEITGWPQGTAVQAAAAIVMDLDTNAVLYGKNLDETHYPASTTKIMTTLIALEHSSLDETFTCGDEVYAIEEDSTNLGIQSGEELTMEQALHGVMLESANDLANAVAVHVAGSVSAFADMMNEKAAQLGCTNTHFVNPSGLHDDQHYTTARDMALIAQAAYENETFRQITAKTEYIIPVTNVTDEERGFVNHQKILRTDTEYYQPWCTGGKTGFTQVAWNTLVTFGEQDGKRLVCVLMRENGASRAYTETTELMNYGFSEFQHVSGGQDTKELSFGQILGLNYPNTNTAIVPENLQQSALSVVQEGMLTIPNSFSKDDLTVTIDGNTVQYSYEGWKLGTMEIAFAPLPETETLAYEQPRDMQLILENSAQQQREDEIIQIAHQAVTQLQDGMNIAYGYGKKIVEENTLTVIWVAAFVLVVLILLIWVLVMRFSRESRIRRKREQEQRAREREQEKIDAMSAVEIEQQLREAMAREAEEKKEREKKAENEYDVLKDVMDLEGEAGDLDKKD